MRLNKQAAWGPLATVANAAPAAPNSLRSSLATQSPLTGKIDELKTAIAAGNPNAALTALAQPLQGLQQLQQLQQLQNLQGLQNLQNLQALAGLPQAIGALGAQLEAALQQLGTGAAAALGQVRDSIDGLAEAVREVDVPDEPDEPDHPDEPDPPGELGVQALALLAPLHAALCKAKPGPVATAAQVDKADKLAVEIAEIDPPLAEDFVAQFRDLEPEDGHSLDDERAERLAELIGVEWRIANDLDEDLSA